MAAIVRSGVRRLVQPTQASGVDALRRPFLARFMSSKEQRLADEIQVKKEELYDLIAVTENSVHTDFTNRLLLRTLSAQVEPRLDDHQWRFMRAAKTRSDVIRPLGIVSGLLLGSASVFVLLSLDDTSKAILKKRKERKAAKDKLV